MTQHDADTAAPESGRTASGRGKAYRIRLGGSKAPASLDATLLLGLVVLLTGFGLVMVLSSSSVEEFRAGNGVSSKFIRQLIFAVLGFVAMYVASRLPLRWWTGKLAGVLLVVTLVLQLLVFTPLGITIGENRAWIHLGFTTLQPAEIAKVALCVWFGFVLTWKRGTVEKWQHLLVPVILPVGAILGIALAGKDLGTVMVLGALVLGCLWFGGMRVSWVITSALVAIAGAIIMAMVSPSRVERITSFFDGDCADYEGLCWQTTHGFYALARGGVFGVGLGNSTAKWSWLPEADNDFIFAIIGEEFGMLGALAVILLFAALTVVLLRIWRTTTDPGGRAIVGGVLTWFTFQGMVNIGVVLGLLPVLGVPLPFLSSGGSALVTTLLAVGIVLAVARNETQGATPAPDRLARKDRNQA